MKGLRLFLAIFAVAAVGIVVGGAAGGAPKPQVCGGNQTLNPGMYGNLQINGMCRLPPAGTVFASRILIMPGGMLDATRGADLGVLYGITIQSTGSLSIGCEFDPSCGVATIIGGINADRPTDVIIHNSFIQGNVAINGGGGGTAGSCSRSDPLAGVPYSDIEDSTIQGNVTVTGYQACWFGMFRNVIPGIVILRDNTLEDPDAMEIADNQIATLLCQRNTPAPQFGDSGGGLNLVGFAGGQCRAVSAPP